MHREDSLGLVKDAGATTYDQSVLRYFDWLASKALERDIKLVLGFGKSSFMYTTDNDDDDAYAGMCFMEDNDNFWTWRWEINK